MKREEYIKKLIKERGYNIKSFSEAICMPYSTLLSMLNGSIGGAAIDNVITICKGLNITVNDLISVTDDEMVKSDIILTEKEKAVITAYREKTNMQNAVDTLLGIDGNTETDNNLGEKIANDIKKIASTQKYILK